MPKKQDYSKQLETTAIEVVNAFDQANTNNAIAHVLRSEYLSEAINELRELLNRNSKKTIISPR